MKQNNMKRKGIPDRRIGLVAGLAGGIIGTAVMRYYIWRIEPILVSTGILNLSEQSQDDVSQNGLRDSGSLGDTKNQADVSASKGAGRMIYAALTGSPPSELQTTKMAVIIEWATGIAAGVIYGATRTTTAPRDLAGGFFYGIRLWLGDMFLPRLVGLRPGITVLSVGEHIRRLLRIWVFSFVITAMTRLIYLFLTQ